MNREEIINILRTKKYSQNIEVIKYMKEHNDPEIVNMFIDANMNLVYKIASKYSKNTSIDKDDLVQEGCIGMLKAIEKFDVESGFSFSTYATWWIRQSITRCISNSEYNIRIPVHMYEKMKRVDILKKEYEVSHEEKVPIGYLAKKLGVSNDEVENILMHLNLNKTVSLSTPLTGKQDFTLGDSIPDSIDVEKVVLDNMQNGKLLTTARKVLSTRELDVIKMRFGLDGYTPLTLDQIGEKYNLSRERIRQIEEKSLRKLKCNKDIRLIYNFE